jgi:flagellar hook-associated protein 2
MSGISTGVGLISGINTAQLIEQLMAIEARPVTYLQARGRALDGQRAAFLSISAQLLAVQNAASKFKKISFFRQFASKSSDETVISAVAGEKATVGSTTLRVHSLVTTHALASRGFADADRTPIGIGSLHLESAAARVDRSTDLDELNGGRGVRRGTIAITDRSGASADIDLSMAFTVSDVLEAINSNTKINVRAHVTGVASNGAQGDRIVIEDESGGSGSLIVADKNGGFTAKDLGIAANISGSRIDGADIYRLAQSTLLSALNDGNGVDRLGQGTGGSDLSFHSTLGDFEVSLSDVMTEMTNVRSLNAGNGVRLGVIRITDRSGASAEVDLTQATTVGEIHDALSTTGLKIGVTYSNSRFIITDNTVPPPPPTPTEPPSPDTPVAPAPELKNLKIEDMSGFAAADLGLAQDIESDTITGNEVYRMTSVGDLVRAINLATGNNGYVEASLSADGAGITLRALGEGNAVNIITGRDLTGNVSQAAQDLGLLNATFSTGQDYTTRPLVGGLNTVLLKSLSGGSGVAAGVVSFTDGAGRTSQIDFASARTLQDVIDIINADQGLALSASINAVGNGIILQDDSAGGGVVSIGDVSGTLAADLGIAGQFDSASSGEIAGGNLDRQYISRQTTLESLNGGSGVNLGSMRITDSNGTVYVVNLDSDYKNVGQIIDRINSATPDTVEAKLNASGDGIVITDTSTGTGKLKIEDQDGGTIAADLRLAGTAKSGANSIDGSFELTVDVNASDSLSDIAVKINALKGGFSATVMSDGGTTNPYALTITSGVSGRHGELMVDSGSLDLGLSTITRPQDAVVTVGQSGGGSAMLVTNSTNTLTNVIPGVTLNLLSESESDITVTTDQDIDSMVEAMQAFTDAYNDAQEAIDKNITFDQETKTRGPLLGDSTVSLVRTRLHSAVSRSFQDVDARVSRLSSVGIRLAANNRLEFDANRFRDAYASTPELVEDLFTQAETGFGARLEKNLDDITRSFDGVLARKDTLLADQQEVLSDRIESLNILLDAKRKRLQNQFSGLESSLAALQGAQNSLSELAVLASR